MSPETNSAETLLETGKSLALQPTVVHTPVGEYLVVPDGFQAEDLADLKPAPRRLAQVVTVQTPDSFMDYVRLFAGTEKRPVVFADLKAKPATITAVLDYHAGPDAPSWNAHRVRLLIQLSRPFSEWKAKNEVEMNQTQFARFIENHIGQIAAPAGATLHEMCLKFEATKAVEFKSHNNVINGAVQLTYNENVQGTVLGNTLAMPTEMTLVMPIVEGGANEQITARIRYRVEAGGKLVLWFDLVNVEDLVEAHNARVADAISAGLAGTIRGVILGSV